MGIFDPAKLIADALVKTFSDRGLQVDVRYERDVNMDQVVWAVIHKNRKETLRANMSDLKSWNRSKPVPFLGEGPTLFIGSSEPTPTERAITLDTGRALLPSAPPELQRLSKPTAD